MASEAEAVDYGRRGGPVFVYDHTVSNPNQTYEGVIDLKAIAEQILKERPDLARRRGEQASEEFRRILAGQAILATQRVREGGHAVPIALPLAPVVDLPVDTAGRESSVQPNQHAPELTVSHQNDAVTA